MHIFTRHVFQGLSLIPLTCGLACAGNSVRPSITLTGPWGGEHVALTITESATHVEFDCAHGDISGEIKTDSQRKFKMPGTFVRERGGPVRKGDNPDSHPASYEGSVIGNTMTLTVRLIDSDESIGTYNLNRGAGGHVVKCRQLAR